MEFNSSSKNGFDLESPDFEELGVLPPAVQLPPIPTRRLRTQGEQHKKDVLAATRSVFRAQAVLRGQEVFRGDFPSGEGGVRQGLHELSGEVHG